MSGVLLASAVAVLSAGEIAGRRQARGSQPPLGGATGRLRVFGRTLTILGGLFTIAGLVGVALLVADPRSTLFLYVGRPVVVLAGLLLVLPAIFLTVLGRSTVLLADHLRGQGDKVDEAA